MQFSLKNTKALLFVGIVILSISCKKEGCTDSQAENYDSDAKKDDGSCVFARDKFIGTYNVNRTCVYQANENFVITVSAGPNINEIIINNFSNDGVNIKATVSGSNVTFNDEKLEIIYEGDGYIINNSMELSYEVCESYYYPCSDPDGCTMTCTKQ